jgi:hypothetical protein
MILHHLSESIKTKFQQEKLSYNLKGDTHRKKVSLLWKVDHSG